MPAAGFFINRSARILICCSLSSPLIYNVTTSFKCKPICKNKVDLPIPGSPATKTMLPKTMPPPNTRFNSESLVTILFSSALLTSLIEMVFCRCPSSTPLNAAHSFSFFLSVPFTITSSTKVFQVLQLGHLPSHFALSYPQFWQKKLDLVLLML